MIITKCICPCTLCEKITRFKVLALVAAQINFNLFEFLFACRPCWVYWGWAVWYIALSSWCHESSPVEHSEVVTVRDHGISCRVPCWHWFYPLKTIICRYIFLFCGPPGGASKYTMAVGPVMLLCLILLHLSKSMLFNVEKLGSHVVPGYSCLYFHFNIINFESGIYSQNYFIFFH